MAGHALYGMAPCFGHTGVTFHAENDRPVPGSLRGHFEAARGRFCGRREFVCVFVRNGHTGVTFDAENDRPGPGSLRGHFEAPEAIF